MQLSSLRCNEDSSNSFTLTSSYVSRLRDVSHLRRCKEGKSRKPGQPLTFDLGEELEACEIHGVHVRGGPPRAENAIALRPTNQLTQTSQHLVFHQHKHRSRLIGVASGVIGAKCSHDSNTNHKR